MWRLCFPFRRRLCWLALLLLGLRANLTTAEAAEPDALFAVVVANNRSLEPALPHLRYADDDGAKYAELFAALGGRVVLLSVLDATTQVRFPELVAKARPPSRRELLYALEESFRGARAARAAGRRVVFYFVYAGHGGVDRSGMGYVHLLDGRLTRSELFQRVIAPSPASFNHIIVDACQAYFLLHGRGAGGWRQDSSSESYQDLLRRFLKNESLERYPRTGVVLATSSSAETHEWSRLESGVFSHEVRSALTGSADVNGNGAVSYSELAAYVAAANTKVTESRARLQIFTRPPAQNLEEPLLRLSGRGRSRLQLAQQLSGRFYLEDARGVRYADFHKSDEQPLTILLAPTSSLYYLHGEAGEARLELPPGPAVLRVDHLGRLALAARSALDESLRRGLYAVPFGRSFHDGYLSAWRQSLEEELPALSAEGRAAPKPPDWRLGIGYLMTTPVLDRGGLAHGVLIGLDRSIISPLRINLQLHYAGARPLPELRQHRISVSLGPELRWRPLPWLALDGSLNLGYLAILESGLSGQSGDAAAFTLSAAAGPELRLIERLWVRLQAALLLDVYRADDTRRVHLAPGLNVQFLGELHISHLAPTTQQLHHSRVCP